MKVISNGNDFHVYNDSVKMYTGLPAGIYNINFNPQTGFSLESTNNIHVDEKVYGIHEAKVNKVMKTFKDFKRNLGIILSGDKGIGKSLFAKMLCEKCVKEGYPVILCSKFYTGIDRFLDSMNQEMMILFDEFDKTFSNGDNDDNSQQNSMLSLFDGTSMNKKLFCVTCNRMNNLNDFLINRPGRFHYHFRFDYPNENEIKTYLKDHVENYIEEEANKIVSFSRKSKLNYDCLRAISYELNSNSTFEQAINDLNIINYGASNNYNITVCFNNGDSFSEPVNIDLFSNKLFSQSLGYRDPYFNGCEDYIKVKFIPSQTIYQDGNFYIQMDKSEITELKEAYEDSPNELKNHHVKDIAGIYITNECEDHSIRFFDV